jgi:hypothetical protein
MQKQPPTQILPLAKVNDRLAVWRHSAIELQELVLFVLQK